MTVSELKAIIPLDDIAELKTDVRYLITIPSQWSIEAVRATQKALTEQGLKGVLCSGEVTFYELG